MDEGSPPGGNQHVTLSVADGVAVITLNRHERLNVFSRAMASLLSAAYARWDADDQVRAVVVTGAGRAFCAGADMAPGADTCGRASEAFSASPVDPPAWEVRKPVIAAVNGHAIGIGLTIAMQCDIRLVANDAKLAVPQVRRGVLGDACSHWTVPRATSAAVAADILLTGRTFLGEEAVRLGLASRGLPAGEVLRAALETARDIAEYCAPLSVALSKRLLWRDADKASVRDLETLYHRVLLGSDDAREGPGAWMERRPPRWSNHVGPAWDRILEAERSGVVAPLPASGDPRIPKRSQQAAKSRRIPAAVRPKSSAVCSQPRKSYTRATSAIGCRRRSRWSTSRKHNGRRCLRWSPCGRPRPVR